MDLPTETSSDGGRALGFGCVVVGPRSGRPVRVAGRRGEERRGFAAGRGTAARRTRCKACMKAGASGEGGDRYAQRGVSVSKGDVHAAIEKVDRGIFPTAFCKIVPDFLGGDDEYCNIMHADGAGTKSSLAYMYWRETGDLSVWRGIAQDAIIMNVDDLLCVGAADNILLSSTIGRNKRLIPSEVISAIISGTEKVLEDLRSHGIQIVSTGGETADLGDLVRTVVVDSTVTCRMRRKDVIANDRIEAGMVVVGLSSHGKASYEKEYNGGMGSNGLTSARHDVFAKKYADKYPESFDNKTSRDLIYCGRLITRTHKMEAKSVTLGAPKSQPDLKPTGTIVTETVPGAISIRYDLLDKVNEVDTDMGRLVLSPTRTYAPVIKAVLDELRDEIGGIVHCSGGAQTKVLRFLKPGLCVVKDNLFPTPLLFRTIQEESQTDWREMYQVFNMGHRMELYVQERDAPRIIQIAQGFGVDAKCIGRVESTEEASPKAVPGAKKPDVFWPLLVWKSKPTMIHVIADLETARNQESE